MNSFTRLEADVKRLADEATPTLLTRLLDEFTSDKRSGLTACERHSFLYIEYVDSQIALTRAKRNFNSLGVVSIALTTSKTERISEELLILAYKRRDAARKAYHSKQCTCWVPKR